MVELFQQKQSSWENSCCYEIYWSFFCMASEILETDMLHLFLLSDGTWIDDNEYLQRLENATELIVCIEEQMQKLSNYFDLNISLMM